MVLTAFLAESGNKKALAVAREVLSNNGFPIRYRSRVAKAVVLAEDVEGIHALSLAIKDARRYGDLRRIVQAIPVETSVGSELLKSVIRDHTAPLAIRTHVGRLLLQLGDHDATRLIREIAESPLTEWNLRGDLIAELIANGEEGLFKAGVTVLRDPNITYAIRVRLTESLMQRGVEEILTDATELLSRATVRWRDRALIAAAMTKLGSNGIERLEELVSSALPLELKLRPLVALIEYGSKPDLADSMVADVGVPTWIRAKLCCSVLDSGSAYFPPGVVEDLIYDSTLGIEFRMQLVVSVSRFGLESASAGAVECLRQRYSESEFEYPGSSKFIRDLSTTGRCGTLALREIIRTVDLAAVDRSLAIIEMASISPVDASQFAIESLPELSAFVRSRLLILLAERGVVEVIEPLEELISEDPAALTALCKLLSSSRADKDLVMKTVAKDFSSSDVVPAKNVNLTELSSDLFLECGLKWSSGSELDAIRVRFISEIEARVGALMSVFLTSVELDEFDYLGEDERFEFISEKTSRYDTVVSGVIDSLVTQIKENPQSFFEAATKKNRNPIDWVAHVAAVAAEWAAVSVSDGAGASARFMSKNTDELGSVEASAILKLASARADSYINIYTGLEFVVRLIRSEGVDQAASFVRDSDTRHDRFHKLLTDASDGRDLFEAGLAGMIFSQSSASNFFYTALGAIQAGLRDYGVQLMMMSGSEADDAQREQGRATITREGSRLQWSDDLISSLINALEGYTADQ